MRPLCLRPVQAVRRTLATAAGAGAGRGMAAAAAEAEAGTARRAALGGKPVLSLEHFLQRARALALYRTIVRGTRQISDPTTRAETRRFAREEFERHRGVTDLTHIRYLISTGKTEWESTERYIGGM